MMARRQKQNVEMIPVDHIAVINPRERNKKAFREIVANISAVGLKKPITVSRRETADGSRYDLVCGQGRLEAFKLLEQPEIPAFVIDAGTEDCLVMSLVENIARRQHRSIDLLYDVGAMLRRGNNASAIAAKTGLGIDYVKGVIRLLEGGEQRLLTAVETGQIPISVAVEIAEAEDANIQQVLQQAYEKKLLRGNKLMAVKRLIEQRQQRGRKFIPTTSWRNSKMTPDGLMRAFQEDVERKRMLVRKVENTRDQLVFITQALRTLLEDESFSYLLKAEGLETLPRNLAERMQNGRVS
jgi:ParB family chromosome partitioning protein